MAGPAVPPISPPATPADLPAILQLLEVSKLPRAELERHIGTTLVAKEGKQLVGTAALELYGAAALLRSVAVAAEQRGHGLGRSEEHTSELQSRSDLVCRLLLEKKK